VTKETFRTLVSDARIAYLPEHMRSSPVLSGVRVFQSLVLYLLFFVSLSFIFWLLRYYLFCCEKHLLITPMVTPNFSYLFRKINILNLANEIIKLTILMISEYVNLPICVLLFVRLLIPSLVNTNSIQW